MKKTLIIIGFIGIFSSCQDKNVIDVTEEEEISIASFEDYYDFLVEKTSTTVQVQSFTSVLSIEKPNHSLSSSIRGEKKPPNLNIDGNSFIFNNYSYSDSKKRSYSDKQGIDLSNFFGNNFSVSYDGRSINLAKKTSTTGESVYIPKEIDVEFEGVDNETNILKVGTKIIWNKDDLNVNGVVIGIEYETYAQSADILEKYPDLESFMTGLTINDSGEYTIKVEDLEDLPNNAVFDFYVGRAGFGIVTDEEGEDHSLSGYTVSTTQFEIQK